MPALTLGALGIVFGDIGTSPLYAMRETFRGHGHEIAVNSANVLGVLSLIVWSLILIISIKYLLFVLRADNGGEGGILALTSLLRPSERRGRRWVLILLGLFGTALLYGDGVITPAISVLSAVEGTGEVTERLEGFAVPIALVILVGLFAIQRRGTSAIGKLFGPVMVTWFLTLAALGASHLVDEPGVLRAVNPVYGFRFFADNGFDSFLALGSVFLVVTGGEALYADMGHFGRRPISRGWFMVALPALALNYFGQGALLLGDPSAIGSPFYRMAPSWGLVPLVVLATCATVIASQALISGVFSLTMQAIQMGYAPRHKIAHTSASSMGQIYIPVVNWALMAACVAVVIGFGSSTNLAAAYGVAVTSTMVVTTMLLFAVLRERFGWTTGKAAALCAAFGVVDLAFFSANLLKIPAGGWFPLVIAAGVFTMMTTWRTGRRLVGDRIRHGQVTLEMFFASLRRAPEQPQIVPGTAVYLFSLPGVTPSALLSNVRHNNVLHRQTVILSIRTLETPRVLPAARSEVTHIADNVDQVVLRYGFMEQPDVMKGLTEGAAGRLGIDPSTASFFLGAESLVVTNAPGMTLWREHLFAVLSRNAAPAARSFNLPPERTVTLGQQVLL
jgi:KUP system potassium uptake protein